ncbi:MAG: methionine--tRNA ligase [Acholeplasmatales bacterium]|jgi:methionyl-tRNA synthetase|nr:methionine--tRNA ligase [Acholeplasmatales bacterium]MCI9653517.1 methionine--tRNA ligase [Acholeplasmatales bacterium]
MEKKFYLTTAIAYTSSKPHIGNVYEAILADAIVRYKKKCGFDTYFQTGTDEHGQKIQLKAEEKNITPQLYVDQISEDIKKIYKLVDVQYDHFIRTTDASHMEEVAKVFEKLFKKGDIYKGTYEGNYCVACESYFTAKDLKDGCCPDCGAKVQTMKEEAYFLKLEPYQNRLIEYIKSHPDFIQPESRKNEMLNNFLSAPLPDLCVSRTSYTWGIPVHFDSKHVIYVWIDALLNYITGIGYHLDSPCEDLYHKFWPCDIHLIGKDILRFHTIYWPIMLMALDLPLPNQIFGHPWVLMNHNKMSKSKGNVIYTEDLVELFGVDAVRYYVLHEIPFASDGNLTYELVCEKNNSDLANTYGNLVNRTMAMGKKYFDGNLGKGVSTEFDSNLENRLHLTIKEYYSYMDKFRVADAIESVMVLLRAANKYIDEVAPWVLAKDSSKKQVLEGALYHLFEVIRIAAILLEPIMPSCSKEIYSQINTTKTSFKDLEYGVQERFELQEAKVLFKRLDVEKDVLACVLAKENAKAKTVVEQKPLVGIEDFDKLDLGVGMILEAKKHPKADKLLVFKVDIGGEVRQIVSGIAKFYDPSLLIGKKVVVVKNLKPILLRGEESYGMLLCASNENDLELLNVEKLPSGAQVS